MASPKYNELLYFMILIERMITKWNTQSIKYKVKKTESNLAIGVLIRDHLDQSCWVTNFIKDDCFGSQASYIIKVLGLGSQFQVIGFRVSGFQL